MTQLPVAPSPGPQTVPACPDGSNLVFLVGCPRSGTTWLQRLLAGHPDVHTGQESNLFKDYISPQMRAFEAGLAGPPGAGADRPGHAYPCGT